MQEKAGQSRADRSKVGEQPRGSLASGRSMKLSSWGSQEVRGDLQEGEGECLIGEG